LASSFIVTNEGSVHRAFGHAASTSLRYDDAESANTVPTPSATTPAP
jgi:hypothetical protein